MRKVLFIVSIIVSVVVFIVSVFFLVNTIIGIPELNYPLTAVVPIIAFTLSIVFAITLVLSTYRWQKGVPAKKAFIIAVVAFVLAGMGFLVASPVNKAIQKNDIGYAYQGISTYSIKGISYDVPNKWRTEEAKAGNYHYPYVENADGLLYVTAQYNEAYAFASRDLEAAYLAVMQGVSSGSDDYYKVISQGKCQIMDKEGYVFRYKTIISDMYFECEQYMVFDVEASTLYMFVFGVQEAIPADIEDSIKAIVGSIRER